MKILNSMRYLPYGNGELAGEVSGQKRKLGSWSGGRVLSMYMCVCVSLHCILAAILFISVCVRQCQCDNSFQVVEAQKMTATTTAMMMMMMVVVCGHATMTLRLWRSTHVPFN